MAVKKTPKKELKTAPVAESPPYDISLFGVVSTGVKFGANGEDIPVKPEQKFLVEYPIDIDSLSQELAEEVKGSHVLTSRPSADPSEAISKTNPLTLVVVTETTGEAIADKVADIVANHKPV